MDITGRWQNELGSILMIEQVENGQLWGTYTTAVSGDSCAKGDFVVSGRTDVDSGGQSIAFAVVWSNENSNCQSVTAWSGQVLTVGGAPVIGAFWLLARATPADQQWQDTLIGQDHFTQSQAGITGNRGAPHKSHP